MLRIAGKAALSTLASRAARRASGVAFRRNREQHLAVKFNLPFHQQGVTGIHRAYVQGPRDIGSADHRNYSGRRFHGFQVQCEQPGMGHTAEPHIGVQQPLGPGQVIHVQRLATDVLVGAVVLQGPAGASPHIGANLLLRPLNHSLWRGVAPLHPKSLKYGRRMRRPYYAFSVFSCVRHYAFSVFPSVRPYAFSVFPSVRPYAFSVFPSVRHYAFSVFPSVRPYAFSVFPCVRPYACGVFPCVRPYACGVFPSVRPATAALQHPRDERWRHIPARHSG